MKPFKKVLVTQHTCTHTALHPGRRKNPAGEGGAIGGVDKR